MKRDRKKIIFTLSSENIFKVDKLSYKYNTQRSILVDAIISGFYEQDQITEPLPYADLKGANFNVLPIEKKKHVIIEFLARRKGKSTGALLDEIISEYFKNHNEEIKS